ncbi:hypothetical protein Mal4_22520 [Maioricimonas rarisocia]|uniref:NIPSNAP domain-containing protein n=1 Tax=Maioricimonas rarisocia TaxID=2528026 RepID=A0A517Z629_9PLAN|nr:NIPSNAP family protein [Maioricimonas rarisocia]QDU37933.1 hypothetical protein Mal4_22520 [Maioricimonas rarisocia]
MHTCYRLTTVLGAVFATALLAQVATAAEDDAPVYELRIYTCEPGKLDPLLDRFRSHTMRIFEKHGMENVAYWVPTDEPKKSNTLIYILRHKSSDAAKASWQAFREDPEWRAVAKASAEQHGKILAERPYSLYMTATDYSPNVTPPKSDAIYELRVYTAAEGKLDALHDRFRQHTDAIFKGHGMASTGYWAPRDAEAGDIMLYVLEYPNREAAKASWKAFFADPNWKKVAEETQKDGRLVSKVESTYMVPTDFSPTAK